jgi:5-methylcytosine-specific restriction endonuclease McrA
METKTCTKCNIAFEKNTDHFELRRKRLASGNGYCEYFRAVCKPCRYKLKQEWRKTPVGKLSRRVERRKRKKLPHVKARRSCSKRLKEFLRVQGIQKDRSSSKYFNFTPRQLQEHLESHFTPEMNWDNYGSYWHIDHVIPLAFYNIKDSSDPIIKEAWKLENLMPLEAKENMRKGSNYNGVRHLYKKT